MPLWVVYYSVSQQLGIYIYNGRIAGISGLLAQFISPSRDIFKSSAFWFIAGLVITPFIYGYFYQPEIEIKANSFVLILAGLLVGFGTRLGSEAVQVGMAFVE